MRFGLSHRDLEELLAERGIEVDHVTIYRWVQRFTPLLAEPARPCRRPIGDRWWIDETYLKVGGRWRYVHRPIDQYGQVIDVYVARKRDSAAARAFFQRALTTAGAAPSEIVTDRAPVYPKLVDELARTTASSTPPTVWKPTMACSSDDSARCATPRNDRTATVIINGHAFVQNLRRGPYNLTAKIPLNLRLTVAFDELRHAI